MAVTVINLSDPVSTLVTKTNTISGDVGDVAQLTTGDDNVVDAINAVRAAIIDIDDSSEIVSISRGGLSVNNDSADVVSLTYSSSTGIIKLVGIADGAVTTIKINNGAVTETKIATSAVTVNKIADNAVVTSKIPDNAITVAKLEHQTPNTVLLMDNTGVPTANLISTNNISNGVITSAKFTGAVSLIIYNDAGTPVKTIYSPGS